jgi:hypothetical protein
MKCTSPGPNRRVTSLTSSAIRTTDSGSGTAATDQHHHHHQQQPSAHTSNQGRGSDLVRTFVDEMSLRIARAAAEAGSRELSAEAMLALAEAFNRKIGRMFNDANGEQENGKQEKENNGLSSKDDMTSTTQQPHTCDVMSWTADSTAGIRLTPSACDMSAPANGADWQQQQLQQQSGSSAVTTGSDLTTGSDPFVEVLMNLAIFDRLDDIRQNFVDGREMIDLATRILRSGSRFRSTASHEATAGSGQSETETSCPTTAVLTQKQNDANGTTVKSPNLVADTSRGSAVCTTDEGRRLSMTESQKQLQLQQLGARMVSELIRRTLQKLREALDANLIDDNDLLAMAQAVEFGSLLNGGDSDSTNCLSSEQETSSGTMPSGTGNEPTISSSSDCVKQPTHEATAPAADGGKCNGNTSESGDTMTKKAMIVVAKSIIKGVLSSLIGS